MYIVEHNLSLASLRKLLRQRRRALSVNEQRQAAKSLYKQIVSSPTFRKARHIGMYFANDGEIDPCLLLKLTKQYKKTIYLPVLNTWPKQTMAFQQLTKHTQWVFNRYKIKEPKANKQLQIHPVKLDLVLMPLVGFDSEGGRLGMGGGFYDRYFSYLKKRIFLHKPYLLGVAHECQKVDKLKTNAWDIKMKAVVTNKNWY